MTSTTKTPPRLFGALLSLHGLALALGGANLVQQGDNAYFLVVGLGSLTAGVLIGLGKLIGAWIYLGVLALMAGWSVVEVGPNFGQLLPRLLVPVVFGAYVFSDRVRSRLF